jgi:hypothetical protein
MFNKQINFSLSVFISSLSEAKFQKCIEMQILYFSKSLFLIFDLCKRKNVCT